MNYLQIDLNITGEIEEVIDLSSEVSNAKKSKFSDFFDEILGVDSAAQASIPSVEEISKYLLYPRLTSTERGSFNLMNWWEANERNYPRLASLAKEILAIPATSVPTERTFSDAGNIITAKRSRLLPENVDMLVFIYHNKNSFKSMK